MKTLLHDFAPMVSQLSEMLGQMYSTIPQASALDLTRQVYIHTCIHTHRHKCLLANNNSSVNEEAVNFENCGFSCVRKVL